MKVFPKRGVAVVVMVLAIVAGVALGQAREARTAWGTLYRHHRHLYVHL